MKRALSFLKNKAVPAGIRPRRVIRGPFRDITLELSLHTEMQMYLGLFEKETHFWLETLTRNIVTGVDVGAAYGEYTLFLLMRTAAEMVYAFEPGKHVHDRFRKHSSE